MSSLLVGVDGSAPSRSAVRWAAMLADALGVPLRALSAWQYPALASSPFGPSELPDTSGYQQTVEAGLRHLLADELGDRSDAAVVEVAPGPATVALLRAAEQDVAMIVVGSRGLGGFEGLLLGSVSQQLCHHAPCPVTVVRGTAAGEARRPATIVVAIDGSTPAARALAFATDLAGPVGASVVVANVEAPEEAEYVPGADRRVDVRARRELVDGWCGPLREAGVGHRVVVAVGDARTALLDLVRDEDADLLVVGSRGHGPVRRLLLGSVAGWLLHHADRPVTVVPHGR